MLAISNKGECIKTIAYYFLAGAIVELMAGVALLTIYNNSLGYMGLIGSLLLMSLIPLIDKVEG